MKEIYLQSEQKKNRRFLIIILMLILFGLTCIFLSRPIYVMKTYSEAEELFDRYRYDFALEKLKIIEDADYKDTAAYISLCNAYKCVMRGQYEDAYSYLDSAHFKYQSETRLESINEVIDSISNGCYRLYLREIEQKNGSNISYNSPTPSKSTTTHSHSSRPSTGYSDGPSTEGFYDPEDFYYEYYDDFYDYEDAEDYYYDHAD